MENDILFDPARMGGVMERVFGEKADDISVIRSLIASESAGINRYSAISSRLGGDAGKTVRQIMQTKRGNLKLLQALYYIKTGKAAENAPSCAVLSGTAEELRLLYRAELNISRDYASAAGISESPELRDELMSMSRASSADAYSLLLLMKRFV